MNDWFTLLKRAVDESGVAAVANKLGYTNHCAITLALIGKYPANTDMIAAKVLDTYARIICPHTGIEISHAECRALSTSAAPTSSPQVMRHWRACQNCQHKGGINNRSLIAHPCAASTGVE